MRWGVTSKKQEQPTNFISMGHIAPKRLGNTDDVLHVGILTFAKRQIVNDQ